MTNDFFVKAYECAPENTGLFLLEELDNIFENDQFFIYAGDFYNNKYSYKSPCMDSLCDCLREMHDYSEDYETADEFYTVCALYGYQPPRVEYWQQVLENFIYNPHGDNICDMLTVISGEPWKHARIRGLSQGDYNEVYYNSSQLTEKDIDLIEVIVFNLGKDFDIETSDGEQYGLYVYKNCPTERECIEEIAEICGCKRSQVDLYRFAGYIQYPRYDKCNIGEGE